MNLKGFLKRGYRAWYYFRMGYSVYLTFLFGYVSTLVTVYYLAVKSVPYLSDVFPRFVPFAVLATVIGGPLSVVIGWIHMKRSRLYSSEADVTQEAYPYNYKLTPGINPEVVFPTALAQLKLLRMMAERNGLLTESERDAIDELEKKYQILIRGGYVGMPKRTLNF